MPFVSDIPTIIFGADVTHPAAGEDSSGSIAAVSFLHPPAAVVQLIIWFIISEFKLAFIIIWMPLW
jgi:hypothetical protein